MQKILAEDEEGSLKFEMQDVYTVSETLCGAKEWLKEVVFDASEAENYFDSPDSLNDLQVGDYFLPIDIGGGTGCMTVLQLASKSPLSVNQIGPTISLEISGAAVDLAFNEWIKSYITQEEYSKDIDTLIRRICSDFTTEKKFCGQRDTWTVHNISGLKENRDKEFVGESLMIDMRFIKACFDRPLDLLEKELKRMLQEHPAIKARRITFVKLLRSQLIYK
ncbi:hypothetical protein PVAG01_00748 [Phlyctema vagabunda]|uniref:Uncharacterized protein n=1 Tax=Phlyctema vagabunda TaxID=108571 RepID=A0ABR4PVE0_9HELO